MKVIYWFNRYWVRVLVGFCGFLNIRFCEKPKPNFFWITGFTSSTADPNRVSKHCLHRKGGMSIQNYSVRTLNTAYHSPIIKHSINTNNLASGSTIRLLN